MEEVCPDAWFLNYTNPMAMLTGFMQRYTGVKTVGLCHSVQVCVPVLAKSLDMPELNDAKWKIAGINHMAWLLERKDKDGNDLYPAMKKKFNEVRPDWDLVRLDMMNHFGYYNTESSEHTAEYHPYYIKDKYPDFIEKYNINERTRKKNSCWTYVDGCGWLCTKAIYPPGSSEKTGYITALINFNASNLFTEINSSFCSGYEYYLFYDGYLGKVYTKEKPEPSNALKKRLTETAVSGKARRYRNDRIYSDDIPGGFTFLTTVRYKYFTDIATHLGSKLVIFFILISALCIFTAIAFTKHIVSDISALRKNIDGYMEELDSRS